MSVDSATTCSSGILWLATLSARPPARARVHRVGTGDRNVQVRTDHNSQLGMKVCDGRVPVSVEPCFCRCACCAFGSVWERAVRLMATRVAWRVARGGRSARNSARSGGSGTASRPCVCDSAASARRSARTATRSLPTSTCMVFPLESEI